MGNRMEHTCAWMWNDYGTHICSTANDWHHFADSIISSATSKDQERAKGQPPIIYDDRFQSGRGPHVSHRLKCQQADWWLEFAWAYGACHLICRCVWQPRSQLGRSGLHPRQLVKRCKDVTLALQPGVAATPVMLVADPFIPILFVYVESTTWCCESVESVQGWWEKVTLEIVCCCKERGPGWLWSVTSS